MKKTILAVCGLAMFASCNAPKRQAVKMDGGVLPWCCEPTGRGCFWVGECKQGPFELNCPGTCHATIGECRAACGLDG